MKLPFNYLKKELKGGAMLFALAILLVISILVSLFFTLNLTYSKLNMKFIKYSEGINKVNEGFKLGYYLNTENYSGEEMNGMNDITIKKKLWGCYFQVSSEFALDSISTLSKIGLIGNELQKDYSLYLSNNNSKLSITGNTLIQGDCFLPEKGIGISYIEGKSFIKKKLIEGNVKTSKSNLPAINQFIIQNNLQKLNGSFNPSVDSIVSINELLERKIETSFLNKTLVIKSNSSIVIDGDWDLKGNIILYSPSRITIEQGAKLDNIILYSKEIKVTSGVQICSQLVAKKFIQLDSNSNLTYPSSLLAIGDSSRIVFLGNSSVNGTVISYSKNSNASNSISISENSRVTGLIYNTNKTEVKGTVYGKLITRKLFHKSPSTEYTNTLIDAEINNISLPNFYSTSSLMKEKNTTVNVIKWLN